MIVDAIDLDPADRATVLELLHRHVPDCEVRAYGSRVTWRARPYSDLDLAVVGSDTLGPLALMELREALANARLPFFVDVLEWEALPDSFCREIERMYVVLQEARVVDGWRDVAVGDIAQIVGGGTPSTKRPEYFGGDVPWLTPKDLSVPHGRYVTRGNRSLTEQGLHQSSATLVPERTVLLTTRAPVGYVALAAQPISTNQGFRNLVVRDEHWPEFVYYWLLANTAELERHASGSTFRELSGSVLKLIRMRVPSKDEQRRIADVLGALDDGIESNRRMCATLEEIASTLFKAWFVDFEPVRAKMEGRWREGESLPGLPAHLYGLFPDVLVELEHSFIPEGWQSTTLGDAALWLSGGTPSTQVPEYWDGDIPWITSGSLKNFLISGSKRRLTPLGVGNGSRIVDRDVTVFVVRGMSLATEFRHGIADVPVAFGQDCKALIAQPEIEPLYLAFSVSSLASEILGMVEYAAHGTGKLSTDRLQSLMIPRPPAAIQRQFVDFVKPVRELMSNLIAQNELLREAKEALLPRLVSGELEISKVDLQLEALGV